MTNLIETYFTILLHQFQYDIDVYSNNMWMYWWVCIPAFCYTVFFMVKWTVLTAPLWMPFKMIFGGGLPVNITWNKNTKT